MKKKIAEEQKRNAELNPDEAEKNRRETAAIKNQLKNVHPIIAKQMLKEREDKKKEQ